jgi:hypothetical protein
VGGLLGIGAKPVALPIEPLEFVRDEDGNIHAVTNRTQDANHFVVQLNGTTVRTSRSLARLRRSSPNDNGF